MVARGARPCDRLGDGAGVCGKRVDERGTHW